MRKPPTKKDPRERKPEVAAKPKPVDSRPKPTKSPARKKFAKILVIDEAPSSTPAPEKRSKRQFEKQAVLEAAECAKNSEADQ